MVNMRRTVIPMFKLSRGDLANTHKRIVRSPSALHRGWHLVQLMTDARHDGATESVFFVDVQGIQEEIFEIDPGRVADHSVTFKVPGICTNAFLCKLYENLLVLTFNFFGDVIHPLSPAHIHASAEDIILPACHVEEALISI